MPTTSSRALVHQALAQQAIVQQVPTALAHYREIGPAAIVAALICTPKKTGKAIKAS